MIEEDQSGEYQSIAIRDGPESIPVKGVSFSRSPESPEESIRSHIALYKDDSTFPPVHTLLNWYCKRHELNLSSEDRFYVLQFMLFGELFPFFWTRNLDKNEILDAVKEVASNPPNIVVAGQAAKVAQFLGRRSHKEVIGKLGSRIYRIRNKYRNYPEGSVLENALSAEWQYRIKGSAFTNEQLEEELNRIVCVSNGRSETARLSRQDQWRAIDLDCVLYSQ